MLGFSELAKCQQLKKVFEDAHKSSLSCKIKLFFVMMKGKSKKIHLFTFDVQVLLLTNLKVYSIMHLLVHDIRIMFYKH